MTDVQTLCEHIQTRFSGEIVSITTSLEEITLIVSPEKCHTLCLALRDEPLFQFTSLIDVCGVDYLDYGLSDWETTTSTTTGFGRGVSGEKYRESKKMPARFAVVYHLLSTELNQRVRLRVFIPDNEALILDSVTDIWPAANWFEREAFDLFGIFFRNHPDLRRILTDYGFVGHPFRKDFPLIGKVEVRYDAALARVIYQPVSIEPRVLEPKVIRHDNRYFAENEGSKHAS